MDAYEIGNTIKERRKVLKITQEQLASIAEVSTKTLGSIEAGVANPELSSLIKICEVLGLQIDIRVKH